MVGISLEEEEEEEDLCRAATVQLQLRCAAM